MHLSSRIFEQEPHFLRYLCKTHLILLFQKLGANPVVNMHEICWFLHLQVIPQTMADVAEVQWPLPKGSLFTAGLIAANTPRVLKIPTSTTTVATKIKLKNLERCIHLNLTSKEVWCRKNNNYWCSVKNFDSNIVGSYWESIAAAWYDCLSAQKNCCQNTYLQGKPWKYFCGNIFCPLLLRLNRAIQSKE